MMAVASEIISAIIVNWNGQEHLPECLQSLTSQDYANLEIIVVDCNSKDNSRGLIKNKFPSVKLIEIDWDCSPPYAINFGANQAKGDYIAILNNDVKMSPDFFSRIFGHIHKIQTDKFLIQPVELDWNGNFLKVGHFDRWITRFFQKLIKIDGKVPFYPSTACCILPKQLLIDTPLNDHLFMYEDMEWGWRLHLKGVEYVSVFDACFYHKYGGTLKMSKKSAFIVGRFLISTAFICLRWFNFLLVLPILFAEYAGLFAIYAIKDKTLLAPLFKGICDFFKKFSLFNQDRKVVQQQRVVSDLDLFKIMLGSYYFHKKSRDLWQNHNRVASPALI